MNFRTRRPDEEPSPGRLGSDVEHAVTFSALDLMRGSSVTTEGVAV